MVGTRLERLLSSTPRCKAVQVLLCMKKIRALGAQAKTNEAMVLVDDVLSLQPENS